MFTSRHFAIAGLLILFFVLGLGMARTKAPWCDEGWFGSAAYHLANNGRLIIPEIEASPEDPKMMRSAEHVYWNVPLYQVWQAAVAKAFGFSLFKARLASLVWGLVALISWPLIVQRLGGKRPALLTLLLLAVDYTFLLKASDVRMDMMSAALGALAILLYLRYRERSLSQACLASQSLVTLSFLTHPNGGLLAFMDTVALALYFDRSRFRFKHMTLIAAPYLIGTVGWGLYLMQDFPLAQVQLGGNASGRFAGLLAPISAFRQEITLRYLHGFGWGPDSAGLARLKILLLVGYATGVFGAILAARRTEQIRPLVLIGGIHFVFLTFLDATKQGAYLVHMIPVVIVLIAVWISIAWRSRSSGRTALTVGASVFCVLQLAASTYAILWKPGKADYLQVIGFLEKHAAHNDLIVGPTQLRFGLGFEKGLSDDQRLGYYSGKQASFVVVDDVYQTWFERFRTERPVVYAHVNSILNTYHLVFHNNSFSIYERPQE